MIKILVVEDNELNMKLFFDVLTYNNYSVDKANDGQEAYNKLIENDFDLMILDIQIPKMNGFELIKKLKDEGKNIPKTLVVSACAMDSDINKAKELGIEDYLTKPIDIVGFLNAVKKLIN